MNHCICSTDWLSNCTFITKLKLIDWFSWCCCRSFINRCHFAKYKWKCLYWAGNYISHIHLFYCVTLNILLIQITIFHNYNKQYCCVSLHTFMTKRQMPAVKFHVLVPFTGAHFAVSREEIVSNVSPAYRTLSAQIPNLNSVRLRKMSSKGSNIVLLKINK